MNRSEVALLAVRALLAAGALTLSACSDDTTSLTGWAHSKAAASQDPNSLAAVGNTHHHFMEPFAGDNGITDPNQQTADDQAVGSPEVVARLHACSKITYASLGSILASRGVSTQKGPQGQPPTAGTLYVTGGASLGMANYAGRVPEAVVASTSAMAKEFDIFVAAAAEVQKNLTNGTACPGVSIADANGQFNQDGISCLIGKPATLAHVVLANQLVAQASDVNTGVQLAIAALLEAAHTCE